MQQLLISILEDLNNTSTDIIASAVISTDGIADGDNASFTFEFGQGRGDFCHFACFGESLGAGTRLRGIGTSDD